MPVSPPLLEARIQRLAFPGRDEPVLRDLELDVEEGEYVVITGALAAGKSTLCHCLTGAIPRFYHASLIGRVRLAGRDLGSVPLPSVAGLAGYLTQEPQAQLVSSTLAEDVGLGPCHLGLPPLEIGRRVEESLAQTGLAGFGPRAPETLSGGEAQRAALAGVLALRPRLLVLDQPAAELDPPGREALTSTLADLHAAGMTIVLVTERPEEVRGAQVRHLVLEEGRLVEADRAAGSGATEWPAPPEGHVPAAGSEAVRLEECTYFYRGTTAGCRDVSLSLAAGELVSLLGANGSGKTTVAKHVNGLLRPQRGKVWVVGSEVRRRSLTPLRRRVAFAFQNPDRQLFASTLEEEVAFAPRLQGCSPQETRRRVQAALGATGLLALAGTHPQRLSRGQRRLLALASVLAGEPEVLVADEPTGGLDGETARLVRGLLEALAARGVAILAATHDRVLAARSHRRLVMEQGLLQGALPPAAPRSPAAGRPAPLATAWGRTSA